MNVSVYVESIRLGVENAAALADDQTRQVAERLAASVESASRLALLQALADAADEISLELAPGSVEMRMSGTEPAFVVSLPSGAPDDVTVLHPEGGAPTESGSADSDGEEPQARVSLRLPQSVKQKVDEYADADGVSTNTWLLQRVLEALTDRSRGGGRTRGQGWGINIGHEGVRLNVPPPVPVPPTPPRFNGSPPGDDEFPPGRNRQSQGRRSDGGRRGHREGGGGPVQGWVR